MEIKTVLDKLHEIEKNKIIYNIHYCAAGVGITFYYPEKDTGDYTKALSTERYYKTFEECIEAEHGKL